MNDFWNGTAGHGVSVTADTNTTNGTTGQWGPYDTAFSFSQTAPTAEYDFLGNANASATYGPAFNYTHGGLFDQPTYLGLPIPSDSPEPELAVVQQACFAAGTFILMAAGAPKVIEQIKIGDEVLCKDDGDPLGPLRARVVDKLHKHSPTALLRF